MYFGGEGVSEDPAEAVKFFRMAAEQGDPEGQHKLGATLYLGLGVLQDYEESHKWLSLAAAGGNKDAMKFRDEFVAKELSSSQLAHAQRLAREWQAKFESKNVKKD